MDDDDADAGKRAKSSVQYGDPCEGCHDHCAICERFIPGLHNGRCRLVKGEIEPMKWCMLFKERDQGRR